MKLTNLEKKIIDFSYPLQQNPGFIKRKSLLHHLEINEKKLDIAIDRLKLHNFLRISQKKTSHNGICYELTELGVKQYTEKHKSFLTKNWYKILLIIAALATIGAFILQLINSENKEEATTFGNQSPLIKDSINTTINYSSIKDSNYLNDRSAEVSKLEPKELVEIYFSSLNSGQYRTACSLLPKLKCDSNDGDEVSEFSKERMKYLNGYENVEIWEASEVENSSEIVCARYSYVLKTDSNPSKVTEIFSFFLDKREDGEWEITSRVCEKKFKEGVGVRNCPIQASKHYCIQD